MGEEALVVKIGKAGIGDGREGVNWQGSVMKGEEAGRSIIVEHGRGGSMVSDSRTGWEIK